jgi:hypothetical protein
MKTFELVTLRFLQLLSICLGTTVIFAIGYAFVQIAIGNVHSTASFEF